MSCHVMTGHVMSCFAVSCHVCHFISWRVVACHVMACHDTPMTCQVMSPHAWQYRVLCNSRNALHEKFLRRQRHLGVDTLVSSQERRAGVVPRKNHGSNAVFVSPIDLNRICFVRLSEESFGTIAFDALWGKRDGCVLGDPSALGSARSRPAPSPRFMPPRSDPPVVYLGFETFRYIFLRNASMNII